MRLHTRFTWVSFLSIALLLAIGTFSLLAGRALVTGEADANFFQKFANRLRASGASKVNYPSGNPLTATRMATRTVTNGNDSGAGSLRQAILDAAANDTINFQAGVTTVALTSASLAADKALTIDGGTSGVTITRQAGSPDFRIFLVTADLTLNKLTLTNGNSTIGATSSERSGGAIRVTGGSLTLTNCTFSGNNSSNNGGAVEMASTAGALTVSDCTFTSNTCGNSGAAMNIFSTGPNSINTSTFNLNTAPTGSSGAMNIGTATTVTNCTFTGNSSAGTGGAITANATSTFTNVTIVGNTTSAANQTAAGGVRTSTSVGTYTFNNCLIAGNTTPNGTNGSTTVQLSNFSSGGTTSSMTGSNNVIGDNTSIINSPNMANGVNNNLIGTAGSPLSAMVDALANNGGPTQTMALQSGSPAINRATSGAPTTDQRGYNRPNTADTGAFEFGGSAPVPPGGQTFANGQNASMVVGQANLTSRVSTASQSVTAKASGIAISSTGKLAVSDTAAHRVLIWNSLPTSDGQNADVVVGQTDFTTATSGLTDAKFNIPSGVAFSPDGTKLIVADSSNHRVMIWNTVPTSNGASANVVIGQSNFTSNTAGTTASTLRNPSGVTALSNGKLLVSDGSNHRVLVYNSIPTASNASADLVIGQSDFTTGTSGNTNTKLNFPGQTTVTSDGKLLVADFLNGRVVIFNTFPSANGAAADNVIGVSGFGVAPSSTPSATVCQSVFGVAMSPAGQLALSDFGNNRVLIYNAIPTTNGAAADVVLGQTDFVHDGSDSPTFNGTPTGSGMNNADYLIFSADGRLWVPGQNMRRVMVFGTAAITAPVIAVSETVAGNIANGGSFSFGTTTAGTPVTKTFTVTNSGTANLTLGSLTAPSGFTIASNFGSSTVAPSGTTTFQIQMTAAAASTPSGALTFTTNDTNNATFTINLSGTVNAAPDLTITKTPVGTFQQGGSASYTLTVTNSGAGPTTSAYTVMDTMPSGLSVSGAVTSPDPGWNCTASTSTFVSCTRTTALAAGASTTLSFPVTIACNAGASLTNTAQVTGGGELVTNNNADVSTVNVLAQTTANAGPDQTICPPALSAVLAANTPSVGAGAWSVVSGPSLSSAQFSNTAAPNATFTPAGGGGSYTLRWTISNSSCTASTDDVVITVPSTVVTNGNDSGAGSLRQAIADACPGSTITFAGSVTSPISLSGGQITLDKSLTIQGPGANLLTISGNQMSRVFEISSGATVTLDSLTIANGNNTGAGGGIYNAGTVNVTNSTISNNSASSGPLSGGGGIYNVGNLTVTNSTISNNSAGIPILSSGSGGGIFNAGGTVTVTNSTISNNSATYTGGGIDNSGTVTVTNSTISNNSAGSGGGIYYDSGTVNSRNSIIAGNTAPTGPDFSGTITSQGHNMIGKTDGSSGWAGTDLTGTIANPINTLLSPLGNYGGPTQTHALLPGSLAINAGDNCVLTVNGCGANDPPIALTNDQRGVARVGAIDIGAFESRGFTNTVSGGNNQSAIIGTNFLNPLVVTVASAFSEPVDGGRVFFFTPGNGASATIAGTPATITGGTATTGTVTANGTAGGPYTVTATLNTGSAAFFSLTNTNPTVLTINRSSANPVNSPNSVSWTVTFNTAVTGLTAGNFSLVNIGLTGPTITNVTGSGTTWTVTASTGTGSGSLGLDMSNSTGVTPTITNVPFTGQVYTVNLPPTTTTINNAGALATATVTGEAYTVQASVSSGGGTPTGTIMVSDGTGATCSILLPATSCTLTSTTIGTKTITASYLGDASFAASTSSGVSHTVSKASTTTTVSAGTLGTATVVGQSYPVIASVAVISPGSFAPTGISRRNNPAFMPPPPVGGPTGNITVSDGSQTCTIALPATSCNLTSTTGGAKTITATYLGDANYIASPASSGVSHTVNAASTTTTITNAASLNSTPTVVGQAYAVNWSVTVNSPGAVGAALTGNVTVSDGSQTCTAAVSAGTCNLTSTTTGAKNITASYAGDANYNTSASSNAPHTVSGAATTTIISNSVALSAVASVVGQSYSVSANVTVTSPGTGTPTGTVTISDGSATCSITLSGGSGSCNLTSTSAGAKTITATYTGDSSFNTSSSTASHTVNKASTTLSSLTDAPDPSVVGQPYTVGFTLSVTAPGAGTPTGTVSVNDGAGGTCMATLPATSCQLTSTVAGNKTVTFTYNGDANFNASPSNTAGHGVNQAATTVAITNDTPDPSVFGQNYAVTAAVSVASPGSGTPTGTIIVSDGTNTCTISLPATACNLPSTSVGAKTLTAIYTGDANYIGNTSAGAPHTVNKADTNTTITSDNPDSSAVGQSVTVVFSVTAASPGAGTPTGNVTVTVSGGSETCTGTVAAGQCSITLTTVGARTLTATYNGDSNFNGGTDTEPHTVVAPPSIAKSFSPSTAPLNTATTLTFTITNPSSNTVALTGVTFTDNFPGAGNLVVATPLATNNTCGGSLQDGGGGSLTAGDTGIKLVGGTVGVGGTCTVSVNVTALAQGPFVNVTGNVSSTNGGTGNTATATLSTNTPPMITPVAISRASGSPASNSTIATVSDNESAAGTLVVTVTSANPSNGVTLSGILNSNGTITANAVAACGATNTSFTLQVSDGSLTATAALNVTVTPDNILPTIGACPTNISVNTATNSCAAVVTFPVPTVSDNCAGATVTCVPASGSSFAKGVTTVTCTPRDAANNTGTACSFTVTVTDNQNPTIACATNQSVTSSVPVVVNYPAPTASDNCAGVTTSCTPASGSIFPLGITTVTCTATDAVNLTASCSFAVKVNNTPIGSPVTVNTPPVSVTFDNVTSGGVTTVTPIVPVPTTPPPPNGYFIQNTNFAYDVTTTAGYNGTVTVCFTVPDSLLATVKFGNLRILHLENGVWVDRTILPPNTPAPNLATRTLCARTTTLSPFVLAWLVESPGPGLLASPIGEKSDQKAGSVLIYNVYTSGTTSANTQNTRINLTNTNPLQTINVHLFFVAEGCSIADSYVCLTPNQTTSFLASDLDPGTSGYLVAVAVDDRGCPTFFNYLIGDEYVKFASGHAANLAAESFAQLDGGLPVCDGNSVTAQLSFDGVSYNRLPATLALSNVGSRADGNDTLLIVNRIGGNLGIGASTLSTLFGAFYDDAENALSFSVSGNCQLRNSISNNFPRTTPRFETFIPAGRTGWLKVFSQTGTAGITGAAINFNANSASSAGAFNQGHNLHALTLNATNSYIIPVFPPSC